LWDAGSDYERIAVGSCRSTGPGKFGRLNVPFVFHAVGPAYQDVLADGCGFTLLIRLHP
jgi:hypothetical protein